MQLSVNPAKNTKQPSLVKPQSDDIISTPRTTLSQMDFFSTSSFWLPDYPAPSAWLEHAPFAFWITEIHRPKVLVELGSHHGFSYFCFCQAMQRLSIDGHCYAVDTWLGDEHAGFYDEGVYSAVNRKNAASYRSLSTLMRMTFDEALAYFPDHSVDLLHIDGRHGYDDVRHDFEQWEPKLSDRGIVLFHDINVREREFGVWKYWHELQQRYPTFAFRHGHGLGVLAVGSNLDPLVARLFDVANSAPLAGAIREGYANLGATVHRLFETADAEQSQRRRAIDLASALEKKEQELTKLHGEAERLTLQAKQFALQLEQITREKEQTIAQLRREAEHSVSQKQQEIAQLQHRFELMAEQKDRELARMREQHDLKTTATTLELERLHREIACLKKTAENVRIKKVITKRLKDYYYPRYPGFFKWSTSYKRWNAKRLTNLPRANADIPTSYNRHATRPRPNDKRHISIKKRITKRLKDIFYPRYPWLFRRTASYKRWYRQAYHADANENHAEWRKSPDCHSKSNNGEGSYAAHGPANPSGTAQNNSAKPVQRTSKPDLPRPGSGDIERDYQRWIASNDEYVPLNENVLAKTSRIKAIAFYLPQFHPIPENDEWWGKGFTEWTNVSKAVPQFVGHYQPRLPGELGFYDLRLLDVMKRQIELAKHYGIHGFCFHYYWFTGRKRLLERPLNQFLAHKELDLPFCICWANENWTRRWDGLDQEVLMEQRHEPEDDLQFIEDLAPVLKDPRYIRVGGKPLVIVYRMGILPDARRTIRVWRDYCRKEGIGELYLVAALTFGLKDPLPYGFDAAVEFPPHNIGPRHITDNTDKVELINSAFGGKICAYDDLIDMYRSFDLPGGKVFKTVAPSWDNEARKPGRGTVFQGSTPALYGQWLREACAWTDRRHEAADEKIVFINGWNEWAEGAYLEPDRRFGYAYLQATRDVLAELPEKTRPSTFRELVAPLSDEKYLELLLRSVHESHLTDIWMPGFPDERVQKQFVGSSWESALQEGFKFYSVVKRYCRSLGVNLDDETRVLDFGCGWGRIARFFFKDIRSENFYGVDVDPEMVAFCAAAMGHGQYHAVESGPPTKFADESIDVIFAYSVFSHLAEPVAAAWIKEMARILRPGGVLIATTQGRAFLDYCERLRNEPTLVQSSWHENLAKSFSPLEKAKSEYDAGKFLYSSTGGGGVRDKSFYGEAVVPKGYIEKEFGRYLSFMDFVDDPSKLPQALFVMQKPAPLESATNARILAEKNDANASSNNGVFPEPSRRIVIVSHDAFPAGAQYQALHLAKMFRDGLGYAVDMVVLGKGVLMDEFAKTARVHDLSGKDPLGAEARQLAEALYAQGVRAAIANTTVSGLFAATLKDAGFRVVALVHELPELMRNYRLEAHAQAISQHCDAVVFAATQVRDGFEEFAKLDSARVVIRPNGLYKKSASWDLGEVAAARTKLRAQLNLAPDMQIVLGVGYADHRKGIDLFVDAAIEICRRTDRTAFVWVGHFDQGVEPAIRDRINQAGLTHRILFPGRVPHADIDIFYAGADIYLLTSREDPYPSVVLEALDAGLPVVAFDGASGCCELIRRGCGRLVVPFDTAALAAEINNLLTKPEEARALGARGRDIIANEYGYRQYAFDLATLADPSLNRVSVIVPNYNHRRYLEERLSSIAAQTYPIYEVIVLDDASTDDSAEWLAEHLEAIAPGARLVANAQNSGSVWHQWRKGMEMARGDFIWIAESDDCAEPGFLAEVLKGFDDSGVVLSYCQSKQMRADGSIIAPDYFDHMADISKDKWTRCYVAPGTEEVRSALAVKNTIPNVSAAVFRRAALAESLAALADELPRYKVSGDLLIYIDLLARGSIAFHSEPLNHHRRHGNSVVHSADAIDHLGEILKVQRLVRERFGVTEQVAQLQDAYAQHVYEYFGLNNEGPARVKDHPAFHLFFDRARQSTQCHA